MNNYLAVKNQKVSQDGGGGGGKAWRGKVTREYNRSDMWYDSGDTSLCGVGGGAGREMDRDGRGGDQPKPNLYV